MILYYAPGACSLAAHIALHEAGFRFAHVAVDLKTHRTADGEDFFAINPKGYVPALVLDSGETLTENVALLDWIAEQAPGLGLGGPMGRTRLLEALAFVSGELHKPFKPFHAAAGVDEKAKAAAQIGRRLNYLAETMRGDFLFGEEPTVADFYLFVMLLWARRFDIEVPPPLAALRDRLMGREAVRAAMSEEGLL